MTSSFSCVIITTRKETAIAVSENVEDNGQLAIRIILRSDKDENIAPLLFYLILPYTAVIVKKKVQKSKERIFSLFAFLFSLIFFRFIIPYDENGKLNK